MNNDLISRSALLEKSFSTAPATMINPYGGESVVRVEDIENAPAVDAETVLKEVGLVKEAFEMAKADLVPVVRCKDCKYNRPEVDAYTHEVVGSWCSLLDLGSVEENHFCSYGKRRTDHEPAKD